MGGVTSNRSEVRDFLVSRRAKITPAQAGLTIYGANRRVPGLRREETAMLAGVSVDYYTRLEKGNLTGVSDSVLDAIAAALQLDEAERLYLANLATAANTSPTRARRRVAHQVRPAVQLILDGMANTPAFVRNGRLDILAINPLGEALYAPAFARSARPVNLARFRFLDPAAHQLYPDFDESAHTTVALLRTEAGRDPYNKALTDLIGELSTRSESFRTLWAAQDVRFPQRGEPMPRKSPYVLVLTADQRRVLEARARRYTSPYREVVWAKIVRREAGLPARGLTGRSARASKIRNRIYNPDH